MRVLNFRTKYYMPSPYMVVDTIGREGATSPYMVVDTIGREGATSPYMVVDTIGRVRVLHHSPLKGYSALSPTFVRTMMGIM